jgi:hypothetical protein
MPDAPLDRLCRESGLSPEDVGFLAEFDDDQLDGLIDAYTRGRDKRERDLDEAVENGLKLVPFFLRTPVRKVLFS